jgi:ABC-type nitrate/sulfonate/bicarbonate transport system permease component
VHALTCAAAALLAHIKRHETPYVLLAFCAVSVCVWAALTETKIVWSPYVPSPSEVVLAFRNFLSPDPADRDLGMLTLKHSFIGHALITGGRLYAALAVGVTLGTVIGLWTGSTKRWHEVFRSGNKILMLIPKLFELSYCAIGIIGIGPLLDSSGTVTVASLAVYAYMALAAHAVVRDPQYAEYVDAARVDGASRWQIFWSVDIRLGKHPLIVALTISLFAALGVTCYAEYMIASSGLGSFLSTMIRNSRMDGLFVVIITEFILTVPGLILLWYLERDPV